MKTKRIKIKLSFTFIQKSSFQQSNNIQYFQKDNNMIKAKQILHYIEKKKKKIKKHMRVIQIFQL